jgi:hypothetical protein
MHVVAFAPSTKAVAQDAGGVRLDGFPMTSAHIDTFPKQITIPLVLAVYTQGGTDYDPRLYAWHWPDNPGAPVKFRVFAHHLPLVVNRAGVYRIGLFDGPDATETDHAFPLPVIQANPLLPPPQPSTRM